MRYQNEKEERMTKFSLIGAAAVLSSVLAGPAMAQHVISNPGYYAWSTYCATRDPGNPFNERYDYQTWSAWRARGGWDSRGDDACLHNPPPRGQDTEDI
jgi:hypothetical protein